MAATRSRAPEGHLDFYSVIYRLRPDRSVNRKFSLDFVSFKFNLLIKILFQFVLRKWAATGEKLKGTGLGT